MNPLTRKQLAVEAVRQLQPFPPAIAQRPPQEPCGSNTAYDCPIAVFLSQRTDYANMTACVVEEKIELRPTRVAGLAIAHGGQT